MSEFKGITSVEWLVKELNQKIDFIPMNKWDEIRDIVEQAKAIHREQSIEDMNKMQIIKDVDSDGNVEFLYNPQQYYKENYGK